MYAEWEANLLDFLQGVYDQFGWLGVFSLMVLESATGMTSSEVILSLAGWLLIETHGLPPSAILLGGLYAGLGNTIGSSLTYWIARTSGRPMVEKFIRWSRIKMETMDWAEAQVRKRGVALVFFGRLVPGVRTVVSIPAGLARMPFGPFLAATFTGTYVWCTALIGVGYVLGHEWMLISKYLGVYFPYLMLGGLGVFLLYLLYIFRAHLPYWARVRLRLKE